MVPGGMKSFELKANRNKAEGQKIGGLEVRLTLSFKKGEDGNSALKIFFDG